MGQPLPLKLPNGFEFNATLYPLPSLENIPEFPIQREDRWY